MATEEPPKFDQPEDPADHRASQIIVYFLGFIVLLVIGVGGLIWYELPSWHNFQIGLRDAKPVIGHDHPTMAMNQQAAPMPTPDTQPQPTEAPALAAATPGQPTNTVLAYLINRFVDGNGPAIQVCDNLVREPNAYPNNAQSFNRALSAHAQTGELANTYVESALLPIAAALRLPAVASMVQTMAAAKDDPSIVQGDDYKSMVDLASSDATQGQPEMSRRSQHAYHLFVLARATAIAPTFANSQDVLSFCNHEQQFATTFQKEQLNDINAAKASLLKLLATANITPQQVGFDSNLKNDVTIDVTPMRLTLHVPWMQAQFGESFYLQNTPDQPAQ